MVDFKRDVARDEEGEEGLDLTRGLVRAALHDSRLKIILLYLTQTFFSWLSFMKRKFEHQVGGAYVLAARDVLLHAA